MAFTPHLSSCTNRYLRIQLPFVNRSSICNASVFHRIIFKLMLSFFLIALKHENFVTLCKLTLTKFNEQKL